MHSDRKVNGYALRRKDDAHSMALALEQHEFFLVRGDKKRSVSKAKHETEELLSLHIYPLIG